MDDKDLKKILDLKKQLKLAQKENDKLAMRVHQLSEEMKEKDTEFKRMLRKYIHLDSEGTQ